jgi:hypothetical protein
MNQDFLEVCKKRDWKIKVKFCYKNYFLTFLMMGVPEYKGGNVDIVTEGTTVK